MNKIKYISILVLFLLTIAPTFSYGAAPTQAELETPTGAGTSKEDPLVKCGTGESKIDPTTGKDLSACDEDDINVLLQASLNLVFIFVGFIVAGMFMYAGFLMITAQGNVSQIQKAKDVFRRVVIGFLIMFLSYVIVKNLLENIGAFENSGTREFFIKLFK